MSAAIPDLVEALVALLERNDDQERAACLREIIGEYDIDPGETKRRIRTLYGGMASFFDFSLAKNGVPLREENEELDRLKSELHTACTNYTKTPDGQPTRTSFVDGQPTADGFDTPPFEDAADRLRRFISSQGGSCELVWIFREDVTRCRCSYWIRVTDAADSLALARRYYEYGREQGLGVTLSMVCDIAGRSACYVWVPKDRLDAEYSMQPPSLKLGVLQSPEGGLFRGQPIRSAIAWWWRLKLNSWRKCVRDESLPTRDEAIGRSNWPE